MESINGLHLRNPSLVSWKLESTALSRTWFLQCLISIKTIKSDAIVSSVLFVLSGESSPLSSFWVSRDWGGPWLRFFCPVFLTYGSRGTRRYSSFSPDRGSRVWEGRRFCRCLRTRRWGQAFCRTFSTKGVRTALSRADFDIFLSF